MTVRVISIVFGGYVLTDGLAALFGILLHALGVPLSEAMLASVLLGFLVYVAIVMWGFVNRFSWVRPVSIIIAAILTKLLASFLAPALLVS